MSKESLFLSVFSCFDLWCCEKSNQAVVSHYTDEKYCINNSRHISREILTIDFCLENYADTKFLLI